MFRQDCNEMKMFSIGGDSFKKSGCAVCSAFHHVEQIKCKAYTPDQVRRICFNMLADGVIDQDFTVMSWSELFNLLGVPVKARYETADYICNDNEIEILKLEKPGYAHFVPGDGKGNYSWDSLGRRPAQRDYHVAEKRIMRLL